jgi:ABC-2 type transport system permease protein
MGLYRQHWVAYRTIVRKEVTRFMRIWPQTIFPPIITQSLYFIIFGKFIGSQVGAINGISYMSFIIPGLVMMSVINNAFVNVAGSFFSSKFQRSIEELLVSPVSNWVIIAGYTTGGMCRGMLVGGLVFGVSFIFEAPQIHHPVLLLIVIFMTSIVFAMGGLANGILAKKFDDVSIVPTFILTPLTYLGGVFYSIERLSEPWRSLSQLNPVLYMINGFRYSFYGFSDVSLAMSLIFLVGFTVILACSLNYLLTRGIGLRS